MPSTKRDYYEVLGVAKNAGDDQVKQVAAYIYSLSHK